MAGDRAEIAKLAQLVDVRTFPVDFDVDRTPGGNRVVSRPSGAAHSSVARTSARSVALPVALAERSVTVSRDLTVTVISKAASVSGSACFNFRLATERLGRPVLYGCFLVIEAHGGTWFRTLCPIVMVWPIHVFRR